jgi:cobalamin-dependent methionine synthase I
VFGVFPAATVNDADIEIYTNEPSIEVFDKAITDRFAEAFAEYLVDSTSRILSRSTLGV